MIGGTGQPRAVRKTIQNDHAQSGSERRNAHAARTVVAADHCRSPRSPEESKPRRSRRPMAGVFKLAMEAEPSR
jgi:hypothetical protein